MSWHEFLLLFFLDRCIRCRSELSDNWCGRNTPMRVRERSRRRLGLPPSPRIPPSPRDNVVHVVAVVTRIVDGNRPRTMRGRPITLLDGNPPPCSVRHHEMFHRAITLLHGHLRSKVRLRLLPSRHMMSHRLHLDGIRLAPRTTDLTMTKRTLRGTLTDERRVSLASYAAIEYLVLSLQ